MQGFGVIGNGALAVAELAVGIATVVVRAGVAGIDGDSTIVIVDRGARFARDGMGHATVVVGDGGLWIEFDGPGVVGDCPVEAASVEVGVAAVDIGG